MIKLNRKENKGIWYQVKHLTSLFVIENPTDYYRPYHNIINVDNERSAYVTDGSMLNRVKSCFLDSGQYKIISAKRKTVILQKLTGSDLIDYPDSDFIFCDLEYLELTDTYAETESYILSAMHTEIALHMSNTTFNYEYLKVWIDSIDWDEFKVYVNPSTSTFNSVHVTNKPLFLVCSNLNVDSAIMPIRLRMDR